MHGEELMLWSTWKLDTSLRRLMTADDSAGMTSANAARRRTITRAAGGGGGLVSSKPEMRLT